MPYNINKIVIYSYNNIPFSLIAIEFLKNEYILYDKPNMLNEWFIRESRISCSYWEMNYKI